MGRRDEARLEAEARDARLEEMGLLEPGQPTETAHRRYVAAQEAEFTPAERRVIRHALRLGLKDFA